MKLEIEFNPNLPFDIQFGDWLPASPASPDAVLYSEQQLSEQEQAQARQNIGAMSTGSQTRLIVKTEPNRDCEVALETELRQSGASAMYFYSGGSDVGSEKRTVLGSLADGERPDDAATVAQAEALAERAVINLLIDLDLAPVLVNEDGRILVQKDDAVLLNI